MFIIFFFQAEDGIRDGHVTGVQTCALPICSLPRMGCLPLLLRYRGHLIITWLWAPSAATGNNSSSYPYPHRLNYRSEEHTSELQSRGHLVCRLLLDKKDVRVQIFLDAFAHG